MNPDQHQQHTEIKKYTFGVPVYNGARTLAATLNSCIHMPAEHIQVIVSDNGSSDGTFELALEYATKYPHIKVVRHETNLGAAGNFKYLLEHCKTEYFMWLAADDVIESVDINEIDQLFASNPDTICVSPYAKVGAVGQEVPDRGNKSLTCTSAQNIIRFLIRPGVNSRFYSIYRTKALQKIYERIFSEKNAEYFASDIVFSVAVLCQSTWPMAKSFILTRKPGVSADGWVLRKMFAKTWLGTAFPSIRFIKEIVGMVPWENKFHILVITLVLYIRYLIGPIRHRLKV